MDEKMRITVVIVTYQSAKVIESCLVALRGVPDVTPLVVDNGSADDTRRLVVATGVERITLERNEGFGAAASRGAEAAKDPLLCFLNPDCLATGDLFEQARARLKDRPGSCVSPSFDQDGRVTPGRQPGYTRRKLLSDILETNGLAPRRLQALKQHPKYHAASWHWPLGTCFIVARERFLELGGFDPAYFMYMEDVDFGRKLCRAGGDVLALDVTLQHKAQEGAAVGHDDRMRLLNAARLTFARRHYGWGFYLYLKAVLSRRKTTW
jgi:GT2 family glycosyltransferase